MDQYNDQDRLSVGGGGAVQPEPLRSERNKKLLRYVLAGVILVVLFRFILYSFEVQKSTPEPKPMTEEELAEWDE